MRSRTPVRMAVLTAAAAVVHGVGHAQTWTRGPGYFDVDTGYVTPHVAWAKPLAGGPVRVLVIGPRFGQRESVELMQRLSAECDVVMTHSAREFGYDNVVGADATSTAQRLKERLAKTYDAIVVGNVDWAMFPDDVLKMLLEKVLRGTGIVVAVEAERASLQALPPRIRGVLEPGVARLVRRQKASWLEPNWSRTEVVPRLEIEGAGSPCEGASVTDGTATVTYAHELYQSLKLVIEPDGRARLLPAELVPGNAGLIDDQDKAMSWSEGYAIRMCLIGAYIRGGDRYRVTVAGRAAGGANSLVSLDFVGAPRQHLYHNRFGATWSTVSDVITLPAEATRLKWSHLWRLHQKGAVWYGRLSIMPDLPAEGVDVSDRVTGKPPPLPTNGLTELRYRDASGEDERPRVRVRLVHESTSSSLRAQTPASDSLFGHVPALDAGEHDAAEAPGLAFGVAAGARVAVLAYPTGFPAYGMLTPKTPYEGAETSLEYEYHMVRVIRAVLWAAGRRPGKQARLEVETDGQNIRPVTTTSGPVRLVVRSRTGEVRAEVAPDTPLREAVLPPLPRGVYFADLWAVNADGEILDWTTRRFAIEVDQAVESIAFPGDFVLPGTTAKATVTLKRPLAEGETLYVGLTDIWDRVLAEAVASVPDKSEVAVELPVRAPLSILHYVTARVLRNGVGLCSHKDKLAVPQAGRGPGWDDFSFYAWGCNVDDGHLGRLSQRRLFECGFDQMSFRGANHGRKAELLAEHGIKLSPYPFQIADYRNKKGDLVRRPCLSDPTVQEGYVKTWTGIASGLRKWGVDAFTLGDENRLGHGQAEYCHSPHCTARFRLWAVQKHGSLEAVNAAWGTHFERVSQIEPLTLAQARETGCRAQWVDHRLFMEQVWVTLNELGARTAQRHLPGCRAGYDGPFQQTSWEGNEWYGLSKVLSLHNSYPFTVVAMELQRSFHHSGDYLGYWDGSYTDIMAEPFQRWVPYRCLFHGFNSVWYWHWYGSTGGSWGAALYPDMRPAPFAEALLEEVRRIKNGLGKLLLATTRHNYGIAIFYSPLCQHVATLDDWEWQARLAGSNGRYCSAMLNAMYMLEDVGLQFDFIADEQVERGGLWEYRLLFLPYAQGISDRAAGAIRRFVRQGGTLIADVRPGTCDGLGRPREPGQLDDVFGISRLRDAVQDAHENVTATLEVGDRTVEGTFLGVKVDASVRTQARHRGATDGAAPICVVNRFGNGTAVLLNFSAEYGVSHYGDAKDEAFGKTRGTEHERPFMDLVLALAALADVEPELALATPSGSLPSGTETAAFLDGRARYFGISRNDLADFALVTQPAQGLTGRFRRPGHCYNARTGQYLGHGQHVEFTQPFGAGLVLALLPYRVAALELAGPAKASAGEVARFSVRVRTAEGDAERHVARTRVFGPDGEERRHYAANVECRRGTGTFRLPLALNDVPGRWRITSRDVATGVESAREFTVVSASVPGGR